MVGAKYVRFDNCEIRPRGSAKCDSTTSVNTEQEVVFSLIATPGNRNNQDQIGISSGCLSMLSEHP